MGQGQDRLSGGPRARAKLIRAMGPVHIPRWLLIPSIALTFVLWMAGAEDGALAFILGLLVMASA